MEVPQKVKNRTTIGSSNSNPGYLSGKNENTNLRRYLHPNVHSSTIYNSHDMEATQVPINRQMDKEGGVFHHIYIYIYIYIYTHTHTHTHTHC